ncbi:hypothetical protein U1Q18_014053, partial [Sarracenia purpurea var. burkii]
MASIQEKRERAEGAARVAVSDLTDVNRERRKEQEGGAKMESEHAQSGNDDRQREEEKPTVIDN